MSSPVVSTITLPYEIKRLLVPMLSITEAAALMGTNEATIRKWIKDGVLPCVRLGRTTRLQLSDMRELTGE
jgi:excisionase family DNA binding protein